MTSGCLKSGILIFAMLSVRALCSEMCTPVVPSFDGCVRTVQGGMFCCFGGGPLAVEDRLIETGKPKQIAWRIDVRPDAHGEVGGYIPLYDDRIAESNRVMPDLSDTPVLKLRLCGELRARQVRIELIEGRKASPDKRGKEAGRFDAKQLTGASWKDIACAIPKDIDRSAIAGIRIILEGEGPAWLGIGAVEFVASESVSCKPNQVKPQRHSLRKAMWVWRTKELLSGDSSIDALLRLCRTYGITDLYVQVPYDRADDECHVDLVDELQAFNGKAHSVNLRVHALDGDPHYVKTENHYKVYQFIDAIGAFNRSCKEDQRFDAIHLDNEPYVLEGWREGEQGIHALLDQYIALMKVVSKKTDAINLPVGADIPFWWDVTENGKTVYTVAAEKGRKPVLEVLFPLLDNVGIMSYRERVTGSNGVVGVCRNEFDLGRRFGTEVFSSIELHTEVEKGISFGVYPKRYFIGQLKTLERALSCEPGCAGVAIHFYGALSEMEKQS